MVPFCVSYCSFAENLTLLQSHTARRRSLTCSLKLLRPYKVVLCKTFESNLFGRNTFYSNGSLKIERRKTFDFATAYIEAPLLYHCVALGLGMPISYFVCSLRKYPFAPWVMKLVIFRVRVVEFGCA